MNDTKKPDAAPKAEAHGSKPKKSLMSVLRFLNEYRKTLNREGGLLPFTMAADLMGVSKQRVHELIKEGTLVPVQAAGKKWLSANQVEAFIKLNRAAGRPWHKPSAKELWKMSLKASKDQVENNG